MLRICHSRTGDFVLAALSCQQPGAARLAGMRRGRVERVASSETEIEVRMRVDVPLADTIFGK
jgi:hypothetical protein